MTYAFNYEPARWGTPARGCRPGAVELLDYVHSIGFGDLGCYNNRPITGTTDTPSVHREGRAVDITPGTCSYADLAELTERLTDNFATLGVQLVIYNGRIWEVGWVGWNPYTGPAGNHTNHAHVELCREAAEANTVELYRDTLRFPTSEPTDDFGDDMPPILYRDTAYANVFAIFASGEVLHCSSALVDHYVAAGSDPVIVADPTNAQTVSSLLHKAGLDDTHLVPFG